MEYDFLSVAVIIAFAILILAFGLAFIRLIKGPTVNDRVAAMDLVASLMMAFVLLYSLMIDQTKYFDIVIIVSLVAFIGTVGVSSYLKQKG